MTVESARRALTPASSLLSQDADVSSRTRVWGQCFHRGLAPGPRWAVGPCVPRLSRPRASPCPWHGLNTVLCPTVSLWVWGPGHRGPPQGGPSITVCVRNPGTHVSHWALLVTFPRDPSKLACPAQLQPTKHLQVCPGHTPPGISETHAQLSLVDSVSAFGPSASRNWVWRSESEEGGSSGQPCGPHAAVTGAPPGDRRAGAAGVKPSARAEMTGGSASRQCLRRTGL